MLHPVRFALCAANLALLLPLLTAQAEAAASCQGQPVTNGCTVNGAVGLCKGTPGNDVIVGTPGPDVIQAKRGHDKVLGRGGTALWAAARMKLRFMWVLALVVAACAHDPQLATSEIPCDEQEPHEESPVECWPFSRELSGAFEN